MTTSDSSPRVDSSTGNSPGSLSWKFSILGAHTIGDVPLSVAPALLASGNIENASLNTYKFINEHAPDKAYDSHAAVAHMAAQKLQENPLRSVSKGASVSQDSFAANVASRNNGGGRSVS